MAGTELAKAYIQIVPSAKGIKGSLESVLEPEAVPAGEKAGQSLGKSLVGKLKGIIAAAGIGKALASSLTEGAALQQSLGGIETLFKESADKVKKNAALAYKTTGMSANAYMEQTTSFAASLLQSLGGDTRKAADIADMAMIDMSDNANKMGTDMESIQFAYQGFAKQNYTMLDNLKLGYGGTKEEMQRLLADAEKLTGVHYDISNLSDVYSAIHVIQENLDITGTTAKEAATTLSGSFASMKASFQNLMGSMALGENIKPKLTELAGTINTFLFQNLLPMLGNVVLAIPPLVMQMFNMLATSLSQNAPTLIPKGVEMILNFAQGIVNDLPKLGENALQMILALAQGLMNSLPVLIEKVPVLINTFCDNLYSFLPKILEAGVKLIVILGKGIINAIPTIISNAGEIVKAILNVILSFSLFSQGKSLIKGMGDGMKTVFGTIKTAIHNLIEIIKNPFKINWSSIGSNIVKGIWKGISGGLGWIKGKITGWVGDVMSFIKGLFGIHSPSRVFRDEVGIYLAKGLGVGFSDGMTDVEKEMEKSIPTSFDVAPTLMYNQENLRTTMPKPMIDNNQEILDILSALQIHHVTTLDKKVIAEETFPVIDKLLGRKMILGKGGIL